MSKPSCFKRSRGGSVETSKRVGWACALVVGVAALNPSARAQTLEVTPDSNTLLSFAGFEGGPFTPETRTSWTLEGTDIRSLDFVASSNQKWLRLSPTSGSLPGSLVTDRTRDVRAEIDDVEASKLAPGLYSATVTFSNLTNEVGNTTRSVRLRVAPASFAVTPSFVNVSGLPGGASPAPVVVTLRGSGQPDLNYRLTWVVRSWFNVDKVGGTVPGGGTDTFTVSFNTFGLAAGTYNGQIGIENATNGAGTRQLPVTLLVQSGGASVVLLRPDLDIEVRGPVGNIPNILQASTLTNNGESPVSWSARSSEDWVSVSPGGGQLAAGNGAGGGADELSVDIRVNAGADDLEAGSHTATVTFENVTSAATAVAIGTRVIHVVVDPVLSLSAPSAGGTISVSPSGAVVVGGTSADLVFPFGDVVTLTAEVQNGFVFQGWTADFHLDSEFVNPLVVTLDESRNVGAIFAPVLQKLTLGTTGQGTGTIRVTPSATVVDNDVLSRYKYGTQISLQADADDGSVFVGWGGNVPAGTGENNPLSVLMDRDRTISAQFEGAVSFDVRVNGAGQVHVSPELEEYVTGSVVTLTAEASPGFSFSGWSGGASGSDVTLTLTLVEDLSIEAVFVEGTGPSDTVALTVVTEGDGTVTPDGGEFTVGTAVTLIATPDVGASFVGWEEDASGSDLTTEVLMGSNRTVRAVFTVASDPDPPGRPNPSGLGALCGATGLVEFAASFLGLAVLFGPGRRGRP